MAEKLALIGDLGGTNARFALVDEGSAYCHEKVLQCAAYESPEAAIDHYLGELGAAAPDVICLAGAGPVRAGEVELMNNHWRLSQVRLRERFAASQVRLLNDFEAVAYSLPLLGEADSIPLGAARPKTTGASYTLGVLGPGTGLGAAGLVSRQGEVFPLVTEAGHLGFAPENEQQHQVWTLLRQRFGRVSDERLVSGAGIENLHQALTTLHGKTVTGMKAAEIFAQAPKDALAMEAVDLFFEILGQVAGNFALSLGAYDGIFIAGGVVQRYPQLMQSSKFRAGFENKGRHRQLMETVPAALILHNNPGLLGAAGVARALQAQG